MVWSGDRRESLAGLNGMTSGMVYYVMYMCCVWISCMGMVYKEIYGEEGGGRVCGLAGGCDVSPPAVHTNNSVNPINLYLYLVILGIAYPLLSAKYYPPLSPSFPPLLLPSSSLPLPLPSLPSVPSLLWSPSSPSPPLYPLLPLFPSSLHIYKMVPTSLFPYFLSLSNHRTVAINMDTSLLLTSVPTTTLWRVCP